MAVGNFDDANESTCSLLSVKGKVDQPGSVLGQHDLWKNPDDEGLDYHVSCFTWKLVSWIHNNRVCIIRDYIPLILILSKKCTFAFPFIFPAKLLHPISQENADDVVSLFFLPLSLNPVVIHGPVKTHPTQHTFIFLRQITIESWDEGCIIKSTGVHSVSVSGSQKSTRQITKYLSGNNSLT